MHFTPIIPTFNAIKETEFTPKTGTKRPRGADLFDVKRRKLDEEIVEKKEVGYSKLSNASIKDLNRKKHNLHSKYDSLGNPTNKKVITINGRDLEVIPLELDLDSKNQNHNIYRFEEGQADLEVHTKDNDGTTQTKTIKLAETILKVSKPEQNDRKKIQVMTNTINAINFLMSTGIPVAEVFAHPANFVDSKNNKNGGFYLVKKMSTSIRCENSSKGIQNPLNDPVVFKFVKEWITKSANDKCIYISDFRPDNVMKDKDDAEGNVFVIDPDLNPDKQDFEESLYGSIKHWAGETKKYFKDLVEDFTDKDLQEKMLNWYEQGYEPKHCVNG